MHSETTQPRNEYHERKQARIERYEARAERARATAAGLSGQARQAVEGIPPGQPILVGHHSEKRHRRALDRHDHKMRAMFEAQDKAEYWEKRAAAAAANTAISADDPQALELLRARVEELTQAHEAMKRINRAYKAGKLADLGYSPEQIAALERRVKTGYSWEQQPYPGWQLSNSNANLRRLQQRIKALEQRTQLVEIREEVNGVEIVQDVDFRRTRLYFTGVPSEEVWRYLKAHGFRWSRSEGCWQRNLSLHALALARQAAALAGGEVKEG
jgi:hypothetical protein